MHVLVAGATGVVGRRIVPLLLRRGDRVTGLTRSAARAAVLRAAGVDPIVVDVVDGKALTDAVRAAVPDVVLHQLTDLAGQDRAANARLRTIGTRNLVDAARAAGTRRIVAQSIAFGYQDGPVPATEDVPLRSGAGGVPELEPRWPSCRNGWSCATACSTVRAPGTSRTGRWPSAPARANWRASARPHRRCRGGGGRRVRLAERARQHLRRRARRRPHLGARLLRRGPSVPATPYGDPQPRLPRREQPARPLAGLAARRAVVAGGFPRLRGGRDAHVALAGSAIGRRGE